MSVSGPSEIAVSFCEDERAKLQFAANQAGLSLAEYLVSCGLKHANQLAAQSEKRVAHLTSQFDTQAYEPKNLASSWLAALGSGQGLYASPAQAMRSTRKRPA